MNQAKYFAWCDSAPSVPFDQSLWDRYDVEHIKDAATARGFITNGDLLACGHSVNELRGVTIRYTVFLRDGFVSANVPEWRKLGTATLSPAKDHLEARELCERMAGRATISGTWRICCGDVNSSYPRNVVAEVSR